MPANLKSVVIPTATSLSRKFSVDFSSVPIAEIQAEVVQRVKDYLGTSRYKISKDKVVECIQHVPISFAELAMAFTMIGIQGSTMILMLIQEWGIAEYVTDFNDQMNSFLEDYVPEK